MSLGGGMRSRIEQKAFDKLEREGVLSIAAAGNNGDKTRSYPASYAGVVSVAAVDANEAVAAFSQQNGEVELAAPGVDVLSTVPWVSENSIRVNGQTYSGGGIENSANGNVTGILVDGGLCEGSGNWNGQVVLCERGNISFYDQVMNVQNAGAAAAVIYNNVGGGFSATLGDGSTSTIPTISLSQEQGQSLLGHVGGSADVVRTYFADGGGADGGGYEAWNGTSMATPHVSGVAALVWSSSTGSSNKEIRSILQSTAKDIDVAGIDNATGYGLVQAYDAWQALGGADPNQAPVADFSFNCSELDCSFNASTSFDSDGSIVMYQWDFGDGHQAGGMAPAHSYVSVGSYVVSPTVTDDLGAGHSSSQTVTVSSGSADSKPPDITNVQALADKGNRFNISWETDEPATTEVQFSCCGVYSDTILSTTHNISFRGSKGELYVYWVISTDVAGNTASKGPFNYQN